MKQLILAVFLFALKLAPASAALPDRNSYPVNQCTGDSAEPFGGGHDTFPWSVAKPFPWGSVEGLWTSIDESHSNIVFEFKVTRSTNQIKQLLVMVYDVNNCKKSNMRGVGLINNFEKNVVRVNMNNVLLKLAMFRVQDLQLNSLTCGQKALGASFYRLVDDSDREDNKNEKLDFEDTASMLLKKVSNPAVYKCKK